MPGRTNVQARPKGYQHQRTVFCDVCRKEVIDPKELESLHLFHAPDCHNHPQNPHRPAFYVGCQCDNTAHAHCCPDCN